MANYDKAVKNIQWEKDSLSKPWYMEIWIPTCKRMKVDTYTINSKQSKGLKVRA